MRSDAELVYDLRVHLQYDLDHIVAEVVQNELGKVDGAIGAEGPLEEALLLGFFSARVAEAPLDEPGQALVTAAVKYTVLQLIKR